MTKSLLPSSRDIKRIAALARSEGIARCSIGADGAVTMFGASRINEPSKIRYIARAAENKKPLRPPATRHKPSRNLWFKERAARDPGFVLNRRVRSGINKCLRGGKNGRAWSTLVDYTLDDLRAHLQARFVEGMTWENIGDWHIDHIRPLASFSIESASCPDFKAAWALSNLQPLWKADNLRKGAKW